MSHPAPNRTPAEKSFAKALKTKGIIYLHNVYLEGYEVDFYLPDYKVVIEIDGYHHLSSNKHQADLRKESVLVDHGYTFFRITNQEIRSDLPGCILRIETYLKNFKACTVSTTINNEWKDSLRRVKTDEPPAPPKKFRTVEEYFLSLDDK